MSSWKKIFFAFFVTSSLLLIATFLPGEKVSAQSLTCASAAASATNKAFTGWAWSDNIGWISFSPSNSGSSGGTYGVLRDTANNGLLAGCAWSDNIGWISFSKNDLTGCLPGVCEARLGTDGKLTGWARAVAGAGRIDGWDGWISLNKKTTDTYNYGPQISSNPSDKGLLVGWAWGSEVVGWLSFNPFDPLGGCTISGVCVPDSSGCFGVCVEGEEQPLAVLGVDVWVVEQSGFAYGQGETGGQREFAPGVPFEVFWRKNPASLNCSPMTGSAFSLGSVVPKIVSLTDGAKYRLNDGSAQKLAKATYNFSISCTDTSDEFSWRDWQSWFTPKVSAQTSYSDSFSVTIADAPAQGAPCTYTVPGTPPTVYTITDGASKKFYSRRTANSGQICQTSSITLTCDDGTLSPAGDPAVYKYSSCRGINPGFGEF